VAGRTAIQLVSFFGALGLKWMGIQIIGKFLFRMDFDRDCTAGPLFQTLVRSVTQVVF